ncbi:MAG: pyruvate kinase [Kiritimatiellia bacterium]
MPNAPTTKIIATLGPASDTYGVIRRMVRQGLDIVRLNFSHGSHASHLRLLQTVRKINAKYRRRVKIMQDLEGFRIRVGRIESEEGMELAKGRRIVLNRSAKASGASTVPFDYSGDLNRIPKGQLIFIDDGNLVLRADSRTAHTVRTTVIEGGRLFSRKGVNMPGVKLDFPVPTEKDREDIEFGVEHEVDFIALSFVRTGADVAAVRDLVKKRHPDCGIIAKIESRDAVRNLESIIKASDGIMIARGDMGIAMPVYKVPMIQKDIIRRCNECGKLVITATQMLESMARRKRPSRAEAADVANAVLDGTDCAMLSGETASGKYPVESVKMMNDIIKYTESRRSSAGEGYRR